MAQHINQSNDYLDLKEFELKTPDQNSQVISKTVFTHVTNLHKLLTDWKRVGEKSSKLIQAITFLRLEECEDDYFPAQLGPLMQSILLSNDTYKNIVEGVEKVDTQLKAVGKLAAGKIVGHTWSAQLVSTEVTRIHNNLLKEYNVKQIVTENIAHCRDQALLEVYSSSWEYEVYCDIESTTYLFSEFGLSRVM